MKMTSLLKKLLIALLGIGMLSVTVPVMASDEPAEETVVETQDEQGADEEATAVESEEQEDEAEEVHAEKE